MISRLTETGTVGIWTTKFGFHNVWEVWVYSVINCAIVSPFFAFSATMLSDLCPKGREVTFFAIWALVGHSTAWIGPFVFGAIIERTDDTWKGFPFALGFCIVGLTRICCVQVKKGQIQAEEYSKNDPMRRESDQK